MTVRDLETFLQMFARPLVTGGEVHVGSPVSPDVLPSWELELGAHADAIVAIDDARAAIADQLLVAPPPLLFGADELQLLVAVYCALVLTHPRAESWPSRRGRAALIAFAARLLAGEPPSTRAGILARHTLLHGLFELSRVDTRLSWWTGRAEFKGTAPPRRLTLWRSLRRVREEHVEVPLTKLVSDEVDSLIDAVIAASPLTDLLTLGTSARGTSRFRWRPGVVSVLRDVGLARAVAYRWLGDAATDTASAPTQLRAIALASEAWEAALDQPARGGLSRDDLRAVTAFLVHCAGLVALNEAGFSDLGGASPLVASCLGARRSGDPADAPSGLRLWFAIPDVAGQVDPAFEAPPGIADDSGLARRWAVHRAQVRAAVGEERLGQLARRLAEALGAQ